MDVKNVFLHGDLHEEVYMQPPPGVEVPMGHVCHLQCALYDLKQARRAWFDRFSSVVTAPDLHPVIMIVLCLSIFLDVVARYSCFMWTTC
jgi:membrane-bound ClpP family serine protease